MPDTPDERPAARARLDSVDLLRGLVMVIMALDHVRDYFHRSGFYLQFDPTDLSRTDTALFVTRWVTHFCAPVFIFLAGTGAFLSASRGKSKSELSKFLFTRGLWLVLLELTVLHAAWSFNFDLRVEMVQVIWALGWSMVALSGLIYLPVWAVAVFGVVMIAVHNLFDGIQAQNLGAFGWLWKVFHEGGLMQPTPWSGIFVAYPLIPWIGVMAAGYGFGRLLLLDRGARRRWLFALGGSLILMFVILRAVNRYGDPTPWSAQKSGLFTFFSFINTYKYPPSLLFLLMTLGPATLALALLDRRAGRFTRPLIVFGRVPLFFYVLHIPLIHGLAVLFARARYGQAHWLFQNPPDFAVPKDYGYSLPVVYLIWIAVVLILYPACRWYAGIKKRRRDGRLSYL
ncbi:MAG: heparan-alpha-glucosaminide N-acetyltransferase domain-containing protein [Candidatus Krumholzibacteriia bacterium]